MRLHRGAPANVSSSDLAPRLDQSRMAASQVGEPAALFCSAVTSAGGSHIIYYSIHPFGSCKKARSSSAGLREFIQILQPGRKILKHHPLLITTMMLVWSVLAAHRLIHPARCVPEPVNEPSAASAFTEIIFACRSSSGSCSTFPLALITPSHPL